MEKEIKDSAHKERRPKEYKKDRKSLAASEFPENPVRSLSVLRSIQIPGIRYEYRAFSNFYGHFEMAHFLILGQFWANGSKNWNLGSLSGLFQAVIFMPFSGAARLQYIPPLSPCFLL